MSPKMSTTQGVQNMHVPGIISSCSFAGASVLSVWSTLLHSVEGGMESWSPLSWAVLVEETESHCVHCSAEISCEKDCDYDSRSSCSSDCAFRHGAVYSYILSDRYNSISLELTLHRTNKIQSRLTISNEFCISKLRKGLGPISSSHLYTHLIVFASQRVPRG